LQLPSRRLLDPDKFAADFLASTRAGVIPTGEFIDWEAVRHIADQVSDSDGPVAGVRDAILNGAPTRDALYSALANSPNPEALVQQLFFLLGHTGTAFVTFDYDVDIKKCSRACKNFDRDAIALLADALADAGIATVLQSANVADVARGIRIGLDTHRRKSLGGNAYSRVVAGVLRDAEEALVLLGHTVHMVPEVTVPYGDGLYKKVDFAMRAGQKVEAVFEINFYTAGGSKPSEVARAYSDLSRKFAILGVPFIWITDGRGWHTMKNVVKEMPLQVPNVYTTQQASEHLASDLAWLLSR